MNIESRAHHERIEAQKLILAQLRQGEKLRKTECEVSGILGKGSRLAPTVEQLRNCYGFIISGDGSFKNPYRLDDIDQLPTKLKLTKEIQDAYYKSDHWRKTRETRRQQDGGCCVTCKTDLSLECHHLTIEDSLRDQVGVKTKVRRFDDLTATQKYDYLRNKIKDWCRRTNEGEHGKAEKQMLIRYWPNGIGTATLDMLHRAWTDIINRKFRV